MLHLLPTSSRTSRDGQLGSKRSAFGRFGILNYYQKVRTRSRDMYMLRWLCCAEVPNNALAERYREGAFFMESKTAIVTGASSGIGLGIARALLRVGYHVVATARNITKAGVLESAERCVLVDGNVADRSLGEQLTEAALAKTDRVNLLVNNAGIFVPGDFHEYTEQQYRAIMSTNADGFFYVTQPAVRQMLKQGGGHVVSISTTLA